MMHVVFSRDDIENYLATLMQTMEVIPPSVELYRIGYMRALRDMGRLVGIELPEPKGQVMLMLEKPLH